MSINNPRPLSKVTRLSWAISLALAAAVLSVPVNAQETAEAQIRATLSHYASGLRDADLASLERAFAENGQFVTVLKDGDIGARPFGEVLPSWVESPDPKVALEITNIRLATPTMAAVTAKLITSTACYDDQLLLLRALGGWRIVAKTTTHYPQCEGWSVQP